MADFSVVPSPRPADYAGPVRDLGSQIAGIPGSYYAGKQQQAEMAMREAFPNGLPKNPDGSINVAAAMDQGARVGGAQWVSPLMQMLLYSQAGTDAAGNAGNIEAGAPGYSGAPSSAPGPQVSAAQPPGMPPVGRAVPPAQQPSPVANAGAPTLRTTIAELAGNKDADDIIGVASRAFRIPADAPLTPQQEAEVKTYASQRLAAASTKSTSDAGSGPPFAPMIPRDGAKPTEPNRPPSGPVAGPTPGGGSQAGPPGQPGAPVQPGGPGPGAMPPGALAAGAPPPQPPQQVAQVAPQAPRQVPLGASTSHIGTPLEGVVPEGMTAGQFIDGNNSAAARYAQEAIKLGKLNPAGATAATKRAEQIEARNKPVLDALAKAGESTPGQKEAAGAGFSNTFSAKRAEKVSGPLDEAVGKNMAEVYERGGQVASKKIQMLDTIGDALKQGNGNITTGPFAEQALKGKQFLSSLFGLDLAGQSEAEIVQKTGFGLASLAVKEITNRPTQMEVKLALTNNPGLLLGPKGSLMMIDLMKQTARQDIALAKMAVTTNPEKWAETVDKFYEDHPLISPFTKKPLGKDDIALLSDPAKNPVPAAPGAASTAATAPAAASAAPIPFASPQELEAAIKSGTVKDGTVVTTPDGRTFPVKVPKVQQ